jgi:hypothetical protein
MELPYIRQLVKVLLVLLKWDVLGEMLYLFLSFLLYHWQRVDDATCEDLVLLVYAFLLFLDIRSLKVLRFW